jgi:hypothetical protein
MSLFFGSARITGEKARQPAFAGHEFARRMRNP